MQIWLKRESTEVWLIPSNSSKLTVMSSTTVKPLIRSVVPSTYSFIPTTASLKDAPKSVVPTPGMPIMW